MGPAHPEAIPLEKVVGNVLAFVGHELEMDKIEVEKTLSPAVAIRADRKQMEEVFLNLIVNACQAMPQGGMLRIAEESQNGHLRVCISDTGEGIPRESVKRIKEWGWVFILRSSWWKEMAAKSRSNPSPAKAPPFSWNSAVSPPLEKNRGNTDK